MERKNFTPTVHKNSSKKCSHSLGHLSQAVGQMSQAVGTFFEEFLRTAKPHYQLLFARAAYTAYTMTKFTTICYSGF